MVPLVIGAMGLLVAGGVLGAQGKLLQGQADSAASDFNANVAEENAGIVRQQTAENERRLRVQSRKAIGDIRASYGASGVTTEGSAIDVLSESAATAELDALTVRNQGALQIRNSQNEAQLERYKSKAAKQGAAIGAAATLLNTAGSALGMVK